MPLLNLKHKSPLNLKSKNKKFQIMKNLKKQKHEILNFFQKKNF